MNEFLKKIKNDKKLSLPEMANVIGVSCSLLAKIFYGKRGVSKSFIKKFKTAYPETDINIFFTD